MPMNISAPTVRESGHKEATLEHADQAAIAAQPEGGDPQAILDGRVLSNASVGRAALISLEDAETIANSPSPLKISPAEARELMDAYRQTQAINDPTSAVGKPPSHVKIESTSYPIKAGRDSVAVLEGHGRVIVLTQSARAALIVEGVENATADVLSTIAASYATSVSENDQ